MPHVPVGSFEPALPPMYSRKVAEAVPFPQYLANARLVVFEGGGHLHNVEHPGGFNSVPVDFLEAHPREWRQERSDTAGRRGAASLIPG